MRANTAALRIACPLLIRVHPRASAANVFASFANWQLRLFNDGNFTSSDVVIAVLDRVLVRSE